jgi:steroid delta-isomerase
MNAAELGEISLQRTKEKDRDGWLALFAPDATLEDPVGAVPGGHQGIEAIAAFHESTISQMDSFDYQIERKYLGGNEAAFVVAFHIVLGDTTMDMDLVNIYKATEDGKIASLRSFWDGTRQGAAIFL